jgi:hypothetical protein
VNNKEVLTLEKIQVATTQTIWQQQWSSRKRKQWNKNKNMKKDK